VGPKVLVIEDDDDIRDISATSLRDAGFDVEAAENGEQALALCARREPDVIVLDLLMPVMDGRAFLRAYRQRASAAVPIVVVSAVPGVEQLAHDLGCQAGIAKPYELTALVNTVAQLARRGMPDR
jgi:two-component system response regulator RpaA